MKSDNNSIKAPFEEKLNFNNNNILNSSLINLSSLIQKILIENKKNKENEIDDFNSSNSIIFNNENQNNINNNNIINNNINNNFNNNIQNSNSEKRKNIEVNKKNIDLKGNLINQTLNNSPNKANDNNTNSNINLNTMSNIKNINFRNYEKNKWINQEEKSNNINAQSMYLDEKIDKNKIKTRNKNQNTNNKTSNNTIFKKASLYTLTTKKSETTKNKVNKKSKNEKSFNKLNSKKNKNRSNSNKNINSKDGIDNIDEENKIKEENKQSFITKNNKIYKIGDNHTRNSNFSNLTQMRKSFQKLNINISNNNVKKRHRSKSNHNKRNKSLSHNTTKINLRHKNKLNNNIHNTTYTNINKEKIMEKLSNLEKSYLILSKSPILHLVERLFFARSTNNLRNIQSVSDILKKNEIFLKDKIKELEERIKECDKGINIVFNPSKTAEINFNFILSKDEEEFKNFIWFAENEKEKTEYYCYTKIIYILFNESNENIETKNLNNNLYILIRKKGFKTIKEYLYSIYFKKKEGNNNKDDKDNNIVYNIDKINSLMEEAEIDQKFNVKFCRFALFTSFLLREIVKYGNDIKNLVELKIKTKEFINVVNNKLELYKVANSFKKIK